MAMKNNQIQGNGDYKKVARAIKDALKPIGKSALQKSGEYLGGLIPIPGAARFGKTVGSMLSKLIGFGDYVSYAPKTNSLLRPIQSVPTQLNQTGHSVRYMHREYIGDLVAGVAGDFNIHAIPVNPGLPNSFPYLHQIARLFEEYKMLGLVFEFVSTSSPYLASGAMGSVVMAMEYNPYSPAFASKPAMENSDFAISARPDQNLVYGVECAHGENTQNQYLVRSGATFANYIDAPLLPGTVDGKTPPLSSTDLGTMYIASQTGIAEGEVIGEVWAMYDLELFRPRALLNSSPYIQMFSADAAGATPLGSQPLIYSQNIISATQADTSTFTFTGASIGDIYLVSVIYEQIGYAGTYITPVLSILSGATEVHSLDPTHAYSFTTAPGQITASPQDTALSQLMIQVTGELGLADDPQIKATGVTGNPPAKCTILVVRVSQQRDSSLLGPPASAISVAERRKRKQKKLNEQKSEYVDVKKTSTTQITPRPLVSGPHMR